jgi:uncharacterized protein (TIGR02099 family)
MLRVVGKSAWSVVVIATIVAAFSLSVARLLLPLVGDYRGEIEFWLAQIIGQPVHIGSIHASLRGINPVLRLKDLNLLGADSHDLLASFGEMDVELDIVQSLLHARPEVDTFRITGLVLVIERGPDGVLRVAGLGGSVGVKGDERSRAQFRRWLLARDRLAIEGAQVVWRRAEDGAAPLTFRDADIVITNTAFEHKLVASVNLPPALGEILRVVVNLRGDASLDADWQGEGYVQIKDAQLAGWRRYLSADLPDIKTGVVDAELWLAWNDGRLRDATAQISARRVELLPPAGVQGSAVRVRSFATLARWRNTSTGWAMRAEPFELALGRAPPVSATLGVELEQATTQSDAPATLHMSLTQAVLQDALQLAEVSGRIPPEALEWLRSSKLQGELKDVYLRWQSAEAAPRWFAQATTRDLAWQPVRRVPGVSGLAGTLYADNDHMVAQLAGDGLRADFSGLFREPLSLDRLSGTLQLQRVPSGWSLRSSGLSLANADGSAEVDLAADIPGDGSAPLLDLVAQLKDLRAEATSRYLPVRTMRPNLVAWLDQAIVAGRVPQAGIVLRGPINRFPFAAGDGRFAVHFDVADGTLQPAAGWPRIEDIRASVRFDEMSMRVLAANAQTLGSDLRNVDARIADFASPRRALTVTGAAQGTLTGGLRYLTESPLNKSIGVHFADAHGEGEVTTALSLRIPLNAAENHVAVKGAATFSGVDLWLAHDAVDLTDIYGKLTFSENSVTADAIAAQVLGQTAQLNVRSEPAEEGRGVKTVAIDAQGHGEPRRLKDRLGLDLLGLLEGSTDWHARLNVAANGAEGEAGAQLTVQSALQGVRVMLPPPLGKEPAATRALMLTLPLPLGPGGPITARYGEDLRGVFEIGREKGKLGLQRGELRFGGIDARLPGAPGVQIAGYLPQFDLAPWLAYLSDAADSAGRSNLFSAINVSLGDARLLGRPYQRVVVEGARRNDGWWATLAGEKLRGTLWLPHDAEAPIRADFERLQVEARPPEARADGAPADPRRLPPLVVSAQDFVYEDLARGKLEATLLHTAQGYRLASGRLENGPAVLIGTGDWTYVNGKHRTELDLVLETENAGATLASFGYAEALSEGVGHHTAYISWAGAPEEYAPAKLSGHAQVRLARGRILEVEPGAGRIFGLLSIQALPRRLTLDFSDLFAKGFTFDSIEGEFDIRDGIATTRDLKVSGPAAEIAIRGEVNLAERSYDEHVAVVPNLTTSLPLAVSVGVGLLDPLAGAAVWVAEKLLRKPVGSLTQFSYRVTGPWDNPVVSKVPRVAETAGASGSE